MSLLRLPGTVMKPFLLRSNRSNEDKEPISLGRLLPIGCSHLNSTFSRSIDPTKKAVAILLLVMSAKTKPDSLT